MAQACGEVLCVIKFTKNLSFNPAEICITGIRCNFNNIAKISTIFDFKWTEVTIDSVEEGSSLLEFVKVQGLKYFINHDGYLDTSINPAQNMMLLELFYLKYRLRDRFIFSYMGEDIPVRFKEPLKIPKVEGNTGVLGSIDLMLIETPNKPIYDISDLNVSEA